MGTIKKSIIYLGKHGIKRTIRHAVERIIWLCGRNRPSDGIDHTATGSLNGYEYKYYRFMQRRKLHFNVSFEDFRVEQKDDLVSVVLPVYNGADMIEESIKSVLEQTYKQFELIIVDDGSTDETPQIVDRWAAKDARIRVIHQKNAKLPRALNNGFALAQGEFLTWTSADNSMHKDFLEKLVGCMRRNPGLAMCYANLRAIDENGKPYTQMGWYTRDSETANAYLPNATLRLNTYPENTVAAAFMYRRAVPMLIGGYDPQLYTVEDYDYWMRINNFLSLRHADFEDIIYDYRFHSKSLTSKAKELHINEMRDKLMLTEDYRQDWLVRPMCWVFEHEEEKEKWAKVAADAKHIVRLYEEANGLQWPQFGSGIIQITTAQKGESVEPKARLTQDAIRVLVCEGGVHAQNKDAFDFVVEIDDNSGEIPTGVIRAFNRKTAFDLIQIFAKARGFDAMIAENRSQKAPELKASIILCTYKRVDAARQALEAMVKQDFDQEKYEILVVNNDPQNRDMQLIAAQMNDAADCAVRYIDCPYPGLSAARNFSLYAARGEIMLYVDDDGIMEKDCLSKLVAAFDAHQDAAVIGGQILLKDPQRFADVILPGYEAIWSERRTDKTQYFYAETDADFPYGCNYAIRRSVLRELGGFRVAYGRMGKDFSGGEEMVLSHLVMKAGMRVGIEPGAVIWHDVEPSRYTLEHVKQTLRASRMTNRLMKMDLYKDYDVGMTEETYVLHQAEDRLESMKKANTDQQSLEYLYCLYDIDALLDAIKAGEQDLEIMKKARELYYKDNRIQKH